MEKQKFIKLGHQAPKGYVYNCFNSVSIEGDFAYCISHNFVYNSEEEKRKLYDGLPCYYTDIRFVDSPFNFYGNTYIHWTRRKNISLKACIRKTLSCKNIPVGTIVSFEKSWYIRKKEVDLSYQFKIKKENKLDINFEINNPAYQANFKTCEFSKKLTDELRKNGFIVRVESENDNFISSMISTAAAYKGSVIETTKESGEIAIAYGFGKKIGFSSKDDTLYGYGNARENILWDRFGDFDKWSRCNEISKETSIEKIVEKLKEKTEEVVV